MENTLLEKAFKHFDVTESGTELLQVLADHLRTTLSGAGQKAINWNVPEKELAFWQSFLEDGSKNDFFPEILKRTVHIHHPKYMGHQVAPPTPITALTGMLSALLNNGMAVYEMGMAPSAMEHVVVTSLCEKLGYGTNAGGLLTSGGTLATLTALLSARKAIVHEDIWNEGHGNRQLGIMVCEEAHYCANRAAKIMGLGEHGIIKIPARDTFSMDVSQLESCFQEARKGNVEIFAIIGSAPSTATGAYDDLAAIARFAKSKGIWFHVDGAHGGAAIYSDTYGHLMKGAEKADSVVIDGHKMLLMPTITTALLFKDRKNMQNTFSQKADYLLEDNDQADWIDGSKKTFECTKTMMSLHWYVLLKFYGEGLFNEYVTRQYSLAQEFAKTLKDHPNFELATWPQSNILCFRWVRSGASLEELNQLNAKIRKELLEDGAFYLVQTKLNGMFYLRTTLMNPFTTCEHLSLLLKRIAEKVEEQGPIAVIGKG